LSSFIAQLTLCVVNLGILCLQSLQTPIVFFGIQNPGCWLGCVFPMLLFWNEITCRSSWLQRGTRNRKPSPRCFQVGGNSHGIPFVRFQVCCNNCGSHLGHVFPTQEVKTNQRHWINSICVVYIKEAELPLPNNITGENRLPFGLPQAKLKQVNGGHKM
jgi:hypothetical protein